MASLPLKHFLLLLCFLLILILIFNSQVDHSYTWLNKCFSHQCDLSLNESDQFICESDELWFERKYVYKLQDKENIVQRDDPKKIFFLSNWEPNFHCAYARRIGNMGDGGKWICDVFKLKTRLDCLIYSIGSNGDFSFETHMKIAMQHCEIHTFDKSLYVCPNEVCAFHQATLGNGQSNTKNWSTIIDELQHRQRAIDILKIDIEGGEFGFFPTIFQTIKSLHPRQILVEIHPNKPDVLHEFFKLLRANHYVIFNREANLIAGSDHFEYCFLKLNEKFFE